jgi:fermentation-respiration switch protein FrsA (DUF1100 family)
LPNYQDRLDDPALDRMDAIAHLEGWRPIPLLALHSEKDAVVPVPGMRAFIARLQERYQSLGADPNAVQFVTWPETGAPLEHLGFGRVSNDTKNLQTTFFQEHLHFGPV